MRGVQGHVGYPHRARNPIPAMAALVTRLSWHVLDKGTEHFEPSTLSFTTVDVGNPATNVIPAEARATFQHPLQRRAFSGIAEALDRRRSQSGCDRHELRDRDDSSLLAAKRLSPNREVSPISLHGGERCDRHAPEFSTTGGTSDARFIRVHCPVAELGLPGGTMHKVDECVPVTEINRLTDIYRSILDHYFAQSPHERRVHRHLQFRHGGLTVMRALMARLPTSD